MPSRVEWRRTGEWVARVAVIGTLAFALWQTTRKPAEIVTTSAMSVSTLERDVTRTMEAQTISALDLTVDAAPTRADRDLLTALRRAGTAIRWSGDVPGVALQVSRAREPYSDGRVTLVSSGTGAIALEDSAGVLDTVRADSGATFEMNTLVGTVSARSGSFHARARVPDAADRRAVLLLGRVGWEVKFAAAALTESGWVVRSSSPAAPGIVVRDDALLPLDTSRYDVVVALDSTASELATAIGRFVAQGGGLVAVGSALDIPSIKAIAPTQAGDRRPGRILLAEDTVTPRDLPMRALTNVRNDAVALSRAGPALMVAARRVGLGRVLAVGYDETWRWRMLGGESGLSSHRAWWSHAAGSVAPWRDAGIANGNGDAAPRAALIDALGEPSAPTTPNRLSEQTSLPLFILFVIIASAVAEIASRRFRGLR